MQLSFLTEGETPQQDLMLMNGPTLRTVEHEPVTDSQGKPVKGPDGKRVVRWFWVHRAVDPEELIAQAIVTADLLDWLRDIAVIRLQGRPRPVTYRTEPKPLDIQRRTTPGTRFRYDLATFALPSEEADALFSAMDADQLLYPYLPLPVPRREARAAAACP